MPTWTDLDQTVSTPLTPSINSTSGPRRRRSLASSRHRCNTSTQALRIQRPCTTSRTRASYKANREPFSNIPCSSTSNHPDSSSNSQHSSNGMQLRDIVFREQCRRPPGFPAPTLRLARRRQTSTPRLHLRPLILRVPSCLTGNTTSLATTRAPPCRQGPSRLRARTNS